MVRPLFALLLLSACSPLDGVVLSVRDAATPDAQNSDAEVAPSDATLPSEDGSFEQPDGDASTIDSSLGIASVCRIAGAESGFFEEFAGAAGLDPNRFLVVHGAASLGGVAPRGGFTRENVAREDGALILRVRGDQYRGSIRGFDGQGMPSAGPRSGAAVVTRDLFASATYSATFSLRGPPNIEVGVWLVRDGEISETIDIASVLLEGESAGPRVRMRTRLANAGGGATELALPQSGDGRALHSLRFDWYTNPQERARFWVDDLARSAGDQDAPRGTAGRMWIAAFVPSDAPADFDTVEIRVERTFLTPFGNDGDRCSDGIAPSLFVPFP